MRALLLVMAVMCFCATSFAQQWGTWCYKDFPSNGTFTVPEGCTKVYFEAIGGGGAGGFVKGGHGQEFESEADNENMYQVSGGGAGGYNTADRVTLSEFNDDIKWGCGSLGVVGHCEYRGFSWVYPDIDWDDLLSSKSYVYPFFKNHRFADGGTTSVKRNSTSSVILEAMGGKTCGNINNVNGAAGGAATGIGDVHYAGGNGGSGSDRCGGLLGRMSSGGGGAAGSPNTTQDNRNGINGICSANNGFGHGGTGSGISGAGGDGTSDWNDVQGGPRQGTSGSNYGGGGGGSKTGTLNWSRGGNGAKGFVRVWFYIDSRNMAVTPTANPTTIVSSGSSTLDAGLTNNLDQNGFYSTTYQWSNSATSATTTVTPTSTQEYCVTVNNICTYATNSDACKATATGCVTVTYELIDITLDNISGNSEFCTGGSTTLTASATATKGTPTYEWTKGSATISTTADVTVTEAGDYTVTASVTVDGVTKTDSKTVTVVVNPLPDFTVTPTPESCKGHDGKATVSPEFVSYAWSNGDNSQAPDTLTSLANGGVYSVTVTDANGCKASKDVTITLNNTLAIEDITGPIVCTGTEFTIFPDDAPEGTTYSWPAPDAISGISGLTAGENQPSINGTLVADPTIITTPTPVAYTVTPKNGVCTGNAIDVTITVTTIVNPGVTITIPREMIKCAGTEVEIPAEFVNSVTPHTVKWVLKGTTDTTTHSNLSVNKDTLRIALPETCSAEYTYLVFDADNSGCVANDGCVITVNSGDWSLEPNKTVEVPCAAAAELQPDATELPTVTDACGITVTPKYAGATRYPYKLSDGSWTVSKVDHKYKYKACDGTTKDWKYTAVVKDLKPEVTCHADITVNTDAGKNYATITLDDPTVDDVCGTPTYAITYSPAIPTGATTENASGQYPVGTTTVTYTVTDNIGQTATCSFTVTVGDDEKPVIVAPADVEVDNYADVPAPLTTLDEFLAGGGSVSDNVGIDNSSFRYTNVSDGKKCPETFTRTYYIKDVNGNESSDVQLVVVNDNIAPTFTAPADITICRALADGSFNADPTITGTPDPATFSDNNTAVKDLKVEYKDLDILPEDETDMRVIRREWKVLDECENATPTIQKINIYPAITAEKSGFTCPADINETLPFGDCEMFINIGEATYGEFFDQKLTLTNNAPADGIYPEGVTTVTWTLTDACGFSITCDQTITVTFPACPTVVDKDGNSYNSVRIGCDCWTDRNLESSTYSDGTAIPGIYNYTSADYPNTDENVRIFGRLYDWASVIKDGADNAYGHTQGICPEGWYLPTAEKYEELNKLGTDALKSSEYWIDGGGSNSTGFTSLPAGYYEGSTDRYMNLMGDAYYWSTTKVDDQWTPVPCNIHYICKQIIGADYMSGLGYSVRCIKEKDAPAPVPTFTCGTSTIQDIDGNTYSTVKIGDQCWMKENLRTTKTPTGTEIALGSEVSYDIAYRYAPNGDNSSVSTYGYLYNWTAVMNGAASSEANPSGVQGICPDGWHVPSDAEWTQLINYVSSNSDFVCGSYSNNIAKALATTAGWYSSTNDCTVGNMPENNNATGFTAVPAGYYNGEHYYNIDSNVNYWSATQSSSSLYAKYYMMYSVYALVYADGGSKQNGYSVRCLQD